MKHKKKKKTEISKMCNIHKICKIKNEYLQLYCEYSIYLPWCGLMCHISGGAFEFIAFFFVILPVFWRVKGQFQKKDLFAFE